MNAGRRGARIGADEAPHELLVLGDQDRLAASDGRDARRLDRVRVGLRLANGNQSRNVPVPKAASPPGPGTVRPLSRTVTGRDAGGVAKPASAPAS